MSQLDKAGSGSVPGPEFNAVVDALGAKNPPSVNSITFTENTGPDTPPPGKNALFFDSADGSPKYVDDQGDEHSFGGSQPVYLVETPLSSVAILDLHNTPVEVAPAPGAGKMIAPISPAASLAYKFGTTPYTVPQSIDVSYGAKPEDGGAVAGDFNSTALSLSEDQVTFNIATPDKGALALYENQPLIISMGDSAPITDGDGTALVILPYIIVDLP